MAISEKTCTVLSFLATGGFCLSELAGTAIWSRALCLVFVGRLHSALCIPVDAVEGEVDRSSKESLGYSTPRHHSCAEGASMSTEDSDSTLHFSVFSRGVTQGVTQKLELPWLMSSRGFLKA